MKYIGAVLQGEKKLLLLHTSYSGTLLQQKKNVGVIWKLHEINFVMLTTMIVKMLAMY